MQYAEELKLDGLVVIGGDDSNTNAAVLAEYFASKGSKIVVNGAPKVQRQLWQ
jgi:6-phosphofructokinase 1